MRTAVRLSLVVIGIAIIALALVGLIEALDDGGAAQIAWGAVNSTLLAAVGAVVARSGVRYDDNAAR